MSVRIESPVLSLLNQKVIGPLFNRTLIIERMDCIVARGSRVNLEGKPMIIITPEITKRFHLEFIPR